MSTRDTSSDPASFETFEHLVVVMYENRSFDSLLGYLYSPGTVPRNQTFNGLAGTEHRNPVPAYINDGNAYVSARISPGTDADMQNPNPDPGEEYQHVNTAAVRRGRSPGQSVSYSGRDAAAVQPPEPRAAGDDDGLRAGLLQQLRCDQGPQARRSTSIA